MAEREFYVGYLPEAPPAVARFTRRVVAVLAVGAVALAVALTSSQQPFSNGVFEFGTTRTLEGRIARAPYPLLVVERPGGGASTYLLSAFGKRGADAIVGEFAGRRVRLEGTLVHRDGQTLVEVVAGSVEALPEAGRGPELAAVTGGAEREFVGEIVDSKCFLGVMKPGATKPHRACATRCIAGGVPPVLLVRDARGRATYLLLTGADGGAVGAELVERALIAEPVRVRGRVDRLGDRLLLRADPASIERVE